MTYQHNIAQKFRFKLLKFILYLEDKAIDFLLSYSRYKTLIRGFLVDNLWNIFFFLLLIVPPILCYIYDWEIPGIYIFYAIIMCIKYLMNFAELMDQSGYFNERESRNPYLDNETEEIENGVRVYKKRKPYVYDPMVKQKEKNGGLTDLEVKNRKKEIWKKLS